MVKFAPKPLSNECSLSWRHTCKVATQARYFIINLWGYKTIYIISYKFIYNLKIYIILGILEKY